MLFIKNKTISKCIVRISILFTIYSMVTSNVFGSMFLYPISTKKSKSSVQSSVSTFGTTPQFAFVSASQVLMEPTTGKILYANNENEKLLPASVTKVMTLLLVMEQIDIGKLSYTDKITCSANASKMGGSQIWFKEGESLSVDEALKAICVVSANDVTVAMSEHIAGSEPNFVKMMNDKALSLGMENTHFMNCHGIDEDDHYTSAKDVAIMSRELILKHPDILKYTSIWMDTLRDGTFSLSSTNKLIKSYEGANGLKTGSTSKALFNLSSSATRDNTTYIAVVMRAPSSDIRLEECKQLLNYGFSTYQIQNIYDKGTVVDSKPVNKNVEKHANITVQESFSTLVDKGSKMEVIENIIYNNDILKAPITANQVVGKLEVLSKISGEKIGEVPLVITEDIPKSSIKEYMKKTFKTFTMCPLA